MAISEAKKQQVYDYFSSQGPGLWFCAAKDWNWSNGTWLLEWIVSQERCTRRTAQIIFWKSQPDYFLPTTGIEAWKKRVESNRELFNLGQLILKNWSSGFYPKPFPGVFPSIAGTFLRWTGVYVNDDGMKFQPGTIGYNDDENPVYCLQSYREEEAQCDPSLLPWVVPDDIGQWVIGKRPSCQSYNLSEGFPDELLQSWDESQ